MRVSASLSIAIFSAAFALSAAAQTQAPATRAPVTDWSLETVVVTAQPPGPAVWHVARGDANVYILATLGPLPRNLQWDTGRLTRILDGARALYLPPRGQVGVFEGIWFLLTQGDILRLPEGETLERVLTPALRARFVAARDVIHGDPDRYTQYKPSVAGFRMEQDFLKANDLAFREPNAAIQTLAATKDVPVQTIATYPALDVVKEVPSLSSGANLKCLSDSLDDMDVMSAHARLAAEAWAKGNLDGVKAHYSEPRALDCLGQSATFTKLWAQSVGDTVSTVNQALSRKGKTVIVVNVGEWLRKGGVLERLRAQGLTLDGPAD